MLCYYWVWLTDASLPSSHGLKMKTTVLGSSLPHSGIRALCLLVHAYTQAQAAAHTLSGWLTCSSWLEHSLIPLLSQMDPVFLFLSGVNSGGACYTFTRTHTGQYLVLMFTGEGGRCVRSNPLCNPPSPLLTCTQMQNQTHTGMNYLDIKTTKEVSVSGRTRQLCPARRELILKTELSLAHAVFREFAPVSPCSSVPSILAVIRCVIVIQSLTTL